MITQIGIISGKILELLERRNGILVFGEIHSDLGQPRETVLMSLGWLLHEKYILIIEDPAIASYRNETGDQEQISSVSAFDLIVVNNLLSPNCRRVKDIARHINYVADRIMILMDGCGGLLDLQAIGRNLNEHQDMILMGVGCLIRMGSIKVILAHDGRLIFSLPGEMANV